MRVRTERETWTATGRTRAVRVVASELDLALCHAPPAHPRLGRNAGEARRVGSHPFSLEGGGWGFRRSDFFSRMRMDVQSENMLVATDRANKKSSPTRRLSGQPRLARGGKALSLSRVDPAPQGASFDNATLGSVAVG